MNKKQNWSVVGIVFLSGCGSRSPSLNILGAYFPDWLFCILGGCLSTVLIYVLLSSQQKECWLSPYILTYPLLIALFSVGYWVIIFS
ncbi:YtcA family lipoprotein [Serratia marcescens]|uniref:YtcA family lipoprotein n=1 Tax=Serratia marcescens TaxID=615 RepID=UPI003638CF94